MTRILVTGGAGFIGTNFIYHLNAHHPDYEVVVLDKLTYAGNLGNIQPLIDRGKVEFHRGDICVTKDVEQAAMGCEVIINFAAETHVDRSIADAEAFIRTDVYGAYKLLEWARAHDVERFVQISTDEVYGEALHPRGSREDDPLMPKSPYAASKAGADRLAYSYYTTYGLPVRISRCSNNYGPYQYPEKLIPLFILHALRDQPLPVYGTGKNTRDWIYVEDHCDGVMMLVERDGIDGEVFNFGGAQERSVLEITDLVLKHTCKDRNLITFVADRPGHVARHAVDTAKAREKLRWAPRHDFAVYMKRTVEWYKNNTVWLQRFSM